MIKDEELLSPENQQPLEWLYDGDDLNSLED